MYVTLLNMYDYYIIEKERRGYRLKKLYAICDMSETFKDVCSCLCKCARNIIVTSCVLHKLGIVLHSILKVVLLLKWMKHIHFIILVFKLL
jgi:hypothetical protein